MNILPDNKIPNYCHVLAHDVSELSWHSHEYKLLFLDHARQGQEVSWLLQLLSDKGEDSLCVLCLFSPFPLFSMSKWLWFIVSQAKLQLRDNRSLLLACEYKMTLPLKTRSCWGLCLHSFAVIFLIIAALALFATGKIFAEICNFTPFHWIFFGINCLINCSWKHTRE